MSTTTDNRRSWVIFKNLAIRSFVFFIFPLPDLHIIGPGAGRWWTLRLNIKITAFGLRIFSFVSVLVFVLFFFPLLSLCFFISIFSWLIQMTRSFLFFLQPTLFLDSVLLFFLFISFVYFFVSSFLCSLDCYKWLSMFFFTRFLLVCHSFFHCYVFAFFILFILFQSLSLVCFFTLYAIPIKSAKVSVMLIYSKNDCEWWQGRILMEGAVLWKIHPNIRLAGWRKPRSPSSASRSRHCAVDRLSDRQDVTELSSEFALVSCDVSKWESRCKYRRCGG